MRIFRLRLSLSAIAAAALSIYTIVCPLGAPEARAQATLVIGNFGGGNAFPFSNQYSGEYQQVYAASAFPGVVTITQLSFDSVIVFSSAFSWTGTLALGTTGATP